MTTMFNLTGYFEMTLAAAAAAAAAASVAFYSAYAFRRLRWVAVR